LVRGSYSHLSLYQNLLSGIVLLWEESLNLYRWFFSLLGLTLLLTGCQTDASAPAPTATSRPPAPDFALETLAEETVRLSDFKGRVVLVNFWASWCPPCRDEMPALEAYYQDHKDEGLVILGVNVKDSKGAITAFLEEHTVSFPIVLDRDAKTAGMYDITGLPTTVFVDREGMVIGTWPGMVTKTFLENKITPLLQEE
jgi:peroxiredoxin